MPRIGEVEESLPWERAAFGATTQDRLQNIAVDSADWRQRAGYPKDTGIEAMKQQRIRDMKIHQWGQHMLQCRAYDEYNVQKVDKAVEEETSKGKQARTRLITKKKVRVADTEDKDANMAMKLDKEWNTAGWGREDIEDAVKVMFEIFYNSKNASAESKKLACAMLVKLVNRHEEALSYVKQNIGQLAGLAASRFLKGGKTMSILDLLHIINACKDRFIFELSECMFVARAHDMICIELRMGVLLFQHMVRSHQLHTKRARRKAAGLAIAGEFGSDAQFLEDQFRNVKARGAELKAKWNSMHVFMSPHQTKTNVGLRAPAYLGVEYTRICLDITVLLVSDKAGKYANSNREDVIRTNGPIFYSQVLGQPQSPFTRHAVSILAQSSKMGESLSPFLHSGCVHNLVKTMRYFLDTGKAAFVFSTETGNSVWNLDEDVALERRMQKLAFFDCLHCLANLASHAAGIHRADRGFDAEYDCPVIKERIFYSELMRDAKSDYRGKPLKRSCLDGAYIESIFANSTTLDMLTMLLRDTKSLNVARHVLRALYGLACSSGLKAVVGDLVMQGGKNLIRVLELVEESDPTVSNLSMCLLLQCTTQSFARSQLFYCRIPYLLSTYIKSNANYNRPTYERHVLIAASLLRQQNWRAYEPVTTPAFFASTADSVRQCVYLDLLKTIKHVPLEDTMESEHLTIADLAVLPMHKDSATELSIIAEELGAKAIADFVSHPHDGDHFVHIGWEEAVAGCEILEALCCGNRGTLQDVYSVGLIHYLGQALHLSRFLFDPAKPPMTERKVMLVLNGVRSAANALASCCEYCITGLRGEQEAVILGIRKADLLGSSTFYISTLTETQPHLGLALKQLQKSVGISVVRFYTQYLRMLLAIEREEQQATQGPVGVTAGAGEEGGRAPFKVSQRTEEQFREVEGMGTTTVRQISALVDSFGAGEESNALLGVLCEVLVELTTPSVYTDLAIHQWRVFTALEKSLPRPLDAVGDPDLTDSRYMQGLGRMPESFFNLVCVLCQLDQGCLYCINMGFLRRALEKLHLLFLKGVIDGGGIATPIEGRHKYRLEAASCLRLIAQVGSFSKAGGGGANDIILHSKFKVVEYCWRVVNNDSKSEIGGEGEGLGRQEPIVLAALSCLASLAKDTTRTAEIFERYDIVGLAAAQMTMMGDLPLEGVLSCMGIASEATYVTTDYVTRTLPKLEKPVQKLSRLYPHLNKAVVDLTWRIAVRLNSFDDSGASAEPGQVFHHRAFYEGSDKDMGTGPDIEAKREKLFSMDRVLAKRLGDIYLEAGIEEEDVGVAEGEAGGISYSSPVGRAPLQKDSKEWHNPSFEQAKLMSSPVEVRERNLAVDSAVRQGRAHEVLGTARTTESPFLAQEFAGSAKLSGPHRESTDEAMAYLMSYPRNGGTGSALSSPALSAHSSNASTGSPSSTTKTVRLFNEGYERSGAGSDFTVTPVGSPAARLPPTASGGPKTSFGESPTSDGGGSLFEGFPPLDSPSSVSTGSPSHVKNPAAATQDALLSLGASSPGKGQGQGQGQGQGRSPSYRSHGKKKKGGKKSKANAGANVVAMDVSDSPDLALTRPTKGGFVFTC